VASGHERTWLASTKADAAELVRHNMPSRCPCALLSALAPPCGRGVAHARRSRRRHALRPCVRAPQARAHCLLASSVITSTTMQTSSAAHWGIGRREPRVRPAYCVHLCPLLARLLPLCYLSLYCPRLICCVPRVDKTKTPRSLGDILTDSGLSKNSVLLRVLVSAEHEAALFYTRHQNPYW